ncbi:MAG: peptidyl-prolyl cis-trans isomerase [Candidatus Cloacimonetes bacterium]|nr:peptidyl-prolyl cis-trans isomerase [Candidatus Cloacimonadota bacterium]
MLRKNRLFLCVVISMMLFSLNSVAAEIPKETVLAEYDGGNITFEYLENKIEQIPGIYRSKYQSTEGKTEVLSGLCDEALFYMEAVGANLEEDEDVLLRIDKLIKPVYHKALRDNIKEAEFSIPEMEMRDHYVQFADSLYAGRTYEEAKVYIERKLAPDKEKAFFEKKKLELFEKFKIIIDAELIESIDVDIPENNKEIREKEIVSSSESGIRKNVGEFIDFFMEMPPQRVAAAKKQGIVKFIEDLVEIDVYYFEALDRDYENKEDMIVEYDNIKRGAMLRSVYNSLVVDPIDNSDEKVREYYEENIEKFSTKASRKIQEFAFDDEDKANKIMRKVRKADKKNKEDEINKLIEENTLHPEKSGIKDHVYQNGIIPGIGKDQAYSDLVWKIAPDEISDVIKNSKDEFVFVRILEDHPSEPNDFEELKDNIKGSMTQAIARENFERIKGDLAVKYNLKKYPDRLIVKLTPEEYFTKAEEAQKKRRFQDAIFYYDQVVKFYPNNTDDYKATFMKAFLYAEEMDKKDEAVKLFEELVTKYPEGELHESADFMIKEIQGETNIFDDINKKEK